MATLTAQDIANYFLAKVDAGVGDSLTNLKLQKLLYYAQGFYLAIHEEPLFDEQIEAWTYGPVVPSIYHEYSKYDTSPLPKPTTFDESKYSGQVGELLDEIQEVFGQFSAWKLANMTHEEPPWENTPTGGVISHKALRVYFKTQLAE